MKIDNVYVAFLKTDCEEHLLYKKSDGNYYYDLITKEKHHVDDIDFNTLIYLRDTIYTINENMLKTNIKRLYNKDRKELIDSNSLVIVDVKKVSDYEKIDMSNKMIHHKWKAVFLYKKLLKKYTSNTYEDIRIKKLYMGEIPNIFYEGIIYVEDGKNNNLKSISEICPNIGSIEKKKVLELAYKVRKGKNLIKDR